MKRASNNKVPPPPPANKRTAGKLAGRDASQVNGLTAERTQNSTDAVRFSELIAQMEEQQHQLELQNLQLVEAQSELEQSRHLYADLYNLAPVGFMTLSGNGCIQEINHPATELLGHPMPYLLGKPVIPYLQQADREKFLKHLWQCNHGQTELRITLRLADTHAGERLVEFTTRPALGFNSRPGWCRTAIVDVTDKRRIADALRESETRFRLLAENAGEIFWFMELNPPRISYVSPAFERIWGLPISKLYADHECWERAIHPDDQPAVRAAFHAWISGRSENYHLDYRVITPDGRTRWIADRGIVIGQKDGCPNHFCGVAHDVTEQKHAEQRYRGLLESAPDAMIIVNQSGLIDEVNAQTLELFGYTRDELLGQPMEMLMPERYRGHHVSHRTGYAVSPHARPMGKGMELFARHKDDGEFPVEVSLSPLETAEGPVIISTVRDITDRKLAEKALQASKEKLRLFVEHSPAPVAMFDRDMRYLVVSKCWSDAFHISDTPFIGRPLYEVIPDIPEIWKQVHQRCLAGATESCERDQFPRANGSLDWVKWECRPWLDARGGIGGIIIFAEIINDRVHIESEIAYAKRFAESTLEAVPASLAVLNDQGIIVGTNQAWHDFAQAHGGTSSKVGKGVNYLDVCDAAAKAGDKQAELFANGIRRVMNDGGKRFSMEYPCHSPREQRWFVGYVTPFKGNGPHSVVIAHVDISERKRGEETIRRLNEKLEDRVARRTAALRIANEDLREEIIKRRQLEQEIAHIGDLERQRIGQDLHDDLGQQIAGISLLSGVLKNNLVGQGSSEVGLAEELIGLLKDALALTRSLARGLQPVALDKGGLSAALEDLGQRTSSMFRIQCRCICPAHLPLDNTESTHLYRIAQEAVTNAVKHASAKQIEIAVNSTPLKVVLSIKDDGSGMTAQPADSMGMGLRVMRYRADLIGGTLEFQPSAEGGTIVICSIPSSRLHLNRPPSYGQAPIPKPVNSTRTKSIHRG